MEDIEFVISGLSKLLQANYQWKAGKYKIYIFGKVSYGNILFLKYSYPPNITNSKTTIYD
jgi:hypothetical protein